MTLINSEYKFHDTLFLLSTSDVDIKDGDIICKKFKNSTETTLDSDKKINEICKYIDLNKSYLKTSDTKYIKKINEKLIKNVTDEKLIKKTNDSFGAFIKMAGGQSERPPPASERTLSRQSIIIQVADAPTDAAVLYANLQLIQAQSPRLQLLEDLSVFDAASSTLTHPQDPRVIVKNLKELGENYKNDPLFSSSEAKGSQLLRLISDIYKPMSVVKIGMVIETSNVESGALLFDAMSVIQDGLPLVTTINLLMCYERKIDDILDTRDLYLQKTGGLVLILPKGMDVKEQGFEVENLVKTPRFRSDQLGDRSFNFVKDLEKIFEKKEDHESGVYRLINLTGHGQSKLQLKEHRIAGLPAKIFQEGLEVLKNRDTLFLGITSCFSGGANAEDIHHPDGTVKFPIYVHSSTEAIALAAMPGIGYKGMLEEVERRLFGPELREVPYTELNLTSLTQTDIQAIGRASPVGAAGEEMNKIANVDVEMHNLGTVFFPSNVADIPKIANTVTVSSHIVDIHREMKDLQKQVLIGGAESADLSIKLKDNATKICFLSDDVIPYEIQSDQTEAMALASRGGSSHHVIKAINAPKQEFNQILLNTFNLLLVFESKNAATINPTGEKVYAIGSMKCLMEGKLVELEDVVIFAGAKERKVIYKNKGETCRRMSDFVHQESATVDPHVIWTQPEGQKKNREVDSPNGEALIYQLFFDSKSKKKDEKAFYEEGIDRFFWKGSAQNQDMIKFFQSINHNEGVFTHNKSATTTFDEAFAKIQAISDVSLRRKIIMKGYEIANKSGQSALAGKLFRVSIRR